ncbi:hypothetical protein [Actinomycetospora callitridis]|uniref:hypothetical protein n=1 Tax=Actinomycetospora callitridis TaxID=913944 RepID=UPI002365BA9C|nr:hypothetical protein [Actinomycetospora callitridis]MDD7919682.1 hypothetical protein [Actinomycetospora callitridis]
MAAGGAEYAQALTVLRDAGFAAQFTQTGGMCAALEVRLERGNLLITDASEELPWDRTGQRGWGVGFYESDDASDGPVEYVEAESPDVGLLVPLVHQCLSAVADARRHR